MPTLRRSVRLEDSPTETAERSAWEQKMAFVNSRRIISLGGRWANVRGRRWVLLVLLAVASLGAISCGCRGARGARRDLERARRLEVLNRTLYAQYATSDVHRAMVALQSLESAELTEHLDGMSDALMLIYSSMSCMEDAQGHRDEAYIYLCKARYYLAVNLEAGRMQHSRIASILASYNQELCWKKVLRHDRENTFGRGARWTSLVSLPEGVQAVTNLDGQP
jgi:hypothetical protein